MTKLSAITMNVCVCVCVCTCVYVCVCVVCVCVCAYRLLEMGCFGIGVSRLLAAALEYGLTADSERILWPTAIAPYHICVACLAHVSETHNW